MKLQSLKAREKEHLETVLRKTGWDLEKTANLLRIPLKQVQRKVREHGIERPLSEGPQEASMSTGSKKEDVE